MTIRIKLRRDTAANWTEANPILAAGEPGLETDTGKIKYGDGTTAWNSLEHAGGDTLTDNGSIVVTAGNTAHWAAQQRRDKHDSEPVGVRYDSLGNLYTLTRTYDGEDNVAVLTKYTSTGLITWQKSIDQIFPYALAVDSADSVYFTGYANNKVQVFKFTDSGSLAWKTEFAQGAEVFGAVIEEQSNSSLAVAITFDDGTETSNILLLRISATDGSILTQSRIFNDTYSVEVGGIDTDPNGNIYITGRWFDVASDRFVMLVEKYESDLVRAWTKIIPSDNNYDMNGGDCASDALGSVYAIGWYSVDNIVVDPGNGRNDETAAILTKLDAGGTVLWTRRIGPGACGAMIAGITATATGDVYLMTNTYENKQDPRIQNDEWARQFEGRNKTIIARYNTAGSVVWQRYLDDPKFYPYYNNEGVHGQTVAVYEDKIAFGIFGVNSNTTVYSWSDSADDETDAWFFQLPTNGTELTLGSFDFTESRVPGRFITLVAETSVVSAADNNNSVTVTTPSQTVDTITRIANNVVRTEAYTYTFGADGTLIIPNDGDVKLTQSQAGYFVAIGGALNYNDDIYGRAIVTDSQGNLYAAGEDTGGHPYVIKYDATGDRQWGVSLQDDNNGNNGRVNGITVHPTTGNLGVVCEFYGTYTYSVLMVLDQDTGREIGQSYYADADSDVYLNELAFLTNGDPVMAGSKNGQFSPEITVTAQNGSTTGLIYINRSDIDGFPNSWQIGGTGFSVFENIDTIERYTNVSGTTRQGSGATFTVQDNGDTTYGYSITTAGTNYLPGHKIKFLGSTLGGADDVNDVIFTVATVNETGGITSVTVSGTAAGTGGSVEYQNQTGANYQVGSGFMFNYWDNPRYGTNYNDYWGSDHSGNAGTNYVEGDVIVVPGTSLGGTSPANDLTLTVSVYNGGVNYFANIAGTSQSTTWKLGTTSQVAFTSGNDWLITYPLSREAVIITPLWQRTFGTNAGNYTDRLYALAVDASNNIIAVGMGYGETSTGSNDDLAMVYKFNAMGALQWAKKLNESNDDCQTMSVTTIGTDIYTSHYSDDDSETVITKLNGNGTVVWQRITDSSDDSAISATADGNLMIAIEAYHEGIDDDAIKVIKMTPNGEVIYKRWISATTDNDTQFKNGRVLAVDATSYYVTAYFYGNDYDSTMVCKLPLDGSGTGEYGSFRYTDVNALTGGEVDYGITDVNFNVNDVILGDGYSGSVDAYVNTNATVTVDDENGYIYPVSFFPDETLEVVRDTDGGRIVFADGTTQSTSATDIPQTLYTGQRYTLGLKDRGHHIYCTNNDDDIVIPYNARVEFPIGTTITVVNPNGGSVYISREGYNGISLMIAGTGVINSSAVELFAYGVATLLKIGRDEWLVSGNVQED